MSELGIVLPEQQSQRVSLYWLGVHTPRTKRLGLFLFLFFFSVLSFMAGEKPEAPGVRWARPKLRVFSLYVYVLRNVKVNIVTHKMLIKLRLVMTDESTNESNET